MHKPDDPCFNAPGARVALGAWDAALADAAGPVADVLCTRMEASGGEIALEALGIAGRMLLHKPDAGGDLRSGVGAAAVRARWRPGSPVRSVRGSPSTTSANT